MALNDYGFYNNGQQLVSVKQQLLDRQAEIDKEQDEIIQEIIDHDYSGGTDLILVTYDELAELKKNGQLSRGTWYRITDYECTTKQAHTKSAGHQFDILVLATSVNTLSEEARAIQSERDKELQSIYSDSFGANFVRCPEEDGDFENEHYYAFFYVNDGYYIYTKSLTEIPTSNTAFEFEDNEQSYVSIKNALYVSSFSDMAETIDNYTGLYFANSNLNAWKIWYCLDNDTSRFAWAKYSLYPAYISYPDILDGEHLEFQGVKDFNGNLELFYGTPEQSERYYEDADANMGWVLRDVVDDESLVGKDRNTWTESLDDDEIYVVLIVDNAFDELFTMHSDNLSSESIVDEGKGVIYRMIDEWGNDCPYDFKNIQFERFNLSGFTKVPSLNYDDSENEYNFPYGAYNLDGSKVISEGSYNGSFYVYTFALKDLNSGIYYDYTVEAHRGLKDDENNEICCYNNVIQPATDGYSSGNGFCAKMLNNCVFFNVHDNIFNPSSSNNYSLNSGIKLGSDCYSLTFGIDCYDIICGNHCSQWTCGNYCYQWACGNDCYQWTCGNDCSQWACGNGCYRWTCGNGCSYWTCGNHCYQWTCGNDCSQWTCGNDCSQWTCGNGCSYWTCGNGCNYWFVVDENTNYFNLLSGCGDGLNLNDYLVNNEGYVQCIGITTDGNIRVWNPADPSGT